MGAGIIYGYFIVGTIVNRFLISPLSKWSTRVEKREGDFRFHAKFIHVRTRYKHATIRAHAEESAAYKAANFEK